MIGRACIVAVVCGCSLGGGGLYGGAGVGLDVEVLMGAVVGCGCIGREPMVPSGFVYVVTGRRRPWSFTTIACESSLG